jgi:hypothetical protein
MAWKDLKHCTLEAGIQDLLTKKVRLKVYVGIWSFLSVTAKILDNVLGSHILVYGTNKMFKVQNSD